MLIFRDHAQMERFPPEFYGHAEPERCRDCEAYVEPAEAGGTRLALYAGRCGLCNQLAQGVENSNNLLPYVHRIEQLTFLLSWMPATFRHVAKVFPRNRVSRAGAALLDKHLGYAPAPRPGLPRAVRPTTSTATSYSWSGPTVSWSGSTVSWSPPVNWRNLVTLIPRR